MKTRSTQRKNSAVARVSHRAARSNYRAWSGGIAALLEENPLINTRLQPDVNERQICQTVSDKFSSTEISQTLFTKFVDARKFQTVSAKSPVSISATLSRKSTGQKYATASRISFVGFAIHLEAPCHAFGNSDGESQRDSGSKPKVARHELPWVSASHVRPLRQPPRVARASQPWAG